MIRASRHGVVFDNLVVGIGEVVYRALHTNTSPALHELMTQREGVLPIAFQLILKGVLRRAPSLALHQHTIPDVHPRILHHQGEVTAMLGGIGQLSVIRW